VRGHNRCRTIRAFLNRSAELRIVTGKLTALAHAHHAVVFTIPATARGQPSIRILPHSEEGQDEREAEYGEQQNGK